MYYMNYSNENVCVNLVNSCYVIEKRLNKCYLLSGCYTVVSYMLVNITGVPYLQILHSDNGIS